MSEFHAPTGFSPEDVPLAYEELPHAQLLDLVYDAVVAFSSFPPTVIGIHAPPGHHGTSLLYRLRHRLDPESPFEPATHHLVAYEPVSPMKRWAQGGQVRTRLTRFWLWRQSHRPFLNSHELPYRMEPLTGRESAAAVTMMLDPSTYETPEHLWDGLTTEIVEGVVRRLPGGQVQRLRFDLNRHRIDPLALRRRILASFLPRTLMGALALCTAVALIVIGVVTASMTAIRTVNLSTLLGPTAVIVLAVLGFLGRSAISQAGTLGTWLLSQRDGVLGPGIRRRDATMPAGRAERLEDEVGPLLSLATRDSSVIIFLRGLDRCRPEIVAATLDFVHVFMNGALPPCTFVLAYDAPTVAAQLETIHTGLRERALAEPLSYGHLRHNGWAILEDYIDLPVRIPSLHGRAAADHLSPWLRRPGTRSADTSPYDVPQPRPGATSRPQPEPESDPYDGPAPRSFAQPELLTDVPEQPWSRIEDLESVRTAMSLAVQAIPDLSPQRIGVFINVWRFYVLLQYQRGQLSFALDEVVKRGCETARYAAILVGWAPILAGLSRPAVGNGSELHLTRLLAAAGDDHAWQTATTETGLDPRDPAAAALRELLRQPDGDDTILADLIRQYL